LVAQKTKTIVLFVARENEMAFNITQLLKQRKFVSNKKVVNFKNRENNYQERKKEISFSCHVKPPAGSCYRFLIIRTPTFLLLVQLCFFISCFSVVLGLYLNHKNLVLTLLYSLQFRTILSTIIHEDRRHET